MKGLKTFSGQFLTAVLVFLLRLVFTMWLKNADSEDKDKQNTNQPLLLDIIQLMTFDEVNTRIDQSLYSPKWKVINCFII
jgi:hypothetical protein